MNDPQTTGTDWQSRLQPADIVAFRFPHERLCKRGVPKVRPTLVLDRVEIGGTPFALLAYGTSSRRPRAPDLLVEVDDVAEIAAASLDAPTRFDGARRILVSLDNAGFVSCPRRRTPVIGRLTGVSQTRASFLRAHIRRLVHHRRASLFGRHRRTSPVATAACNGDSQ